ncbi:MAG: DUF805 domain-containing protein [Gemmatimonadaceae bacterium]|nr:DUF805 domain-containing protein [Gemmatimonadaceae bacterium]
MHWYLKVWKQYNVFTGRSRRSEYWWFVLINFVILVLLSFAGPAGASGYNLLTLFYSLASLVPTIAVSARRLHDIGRSGWWMLVPIVGFVMMIFDSQPGTNEYGPNSKETPELAPE